MSLSADTLTSHARNRGVRAAVPERSHRPRVFGRWRALLIVAVGSAAVWWVGMLRIPAGPAAGRSFNGTAIVAPPAQRTFRVGIFNIHGGRGADRQRDLQRTADCLRGLDVVGLNEVLGPRFPWQSDQCQQLGELLQTQFLYAPTEWRCLNVSFGNAMLTSLPVRSWQTIPLPRGGAHTYRNAVLTTIELGERRVQVLLTHLDSRDPERRQEQLRIVGDLFLSLTAPAILMGDMNSHPDDPQILRLLENADVTDAIAAGVGNLPRRIDWILTRGLNTVNAAIVENDASDHPCYWAELEIRD